MNSELISKYVNLVMEFNKIKLDDLDPFLELKYDDYIDQLDKAWFDLTKEEQLEAERKVKEDNP